jgi:hypothetical protein
VFRKFRLLVILELYVIISKYYSCRMSSSRGPCGPTDAAVENNEDFLDPSLSANYFSDLLWMPHDQHKVSRINDDVSYIIDHIIYIFIK